VRTSISGFVENTSREPMSGVRIKLVGTALPHRLLRKAPLSCPMSRPARSTLTLRETRSRPHLRTQRSRSRRLHSPAVTISFHVLSHCNSRRARAAASVDRAPSVNP
jgi:hypothetical protein